MGTPSALSYRAALPDICTDSGNEGSADMFSPEAELRALRAKRRVNEEAAVREATARIDLDRDSVTKAAAFPESLEPIDEARRRIVLEAMAAAEAAAAAHVTAARAEAAEAVAEAVGVAEAAQAEMASVMAPAAAAEVEAVVEALESPQPPPLPAYFLLKPALAPPTPLAVPKPASSASLWGPHTPAWEQQRKVGLDGLESIDDLGRFVDAAAVITTPLTPRSTPGSAKQLSRSVPFWDRENFALLGPPPASPARPKRMSPLKPGFSLSAAANRVCNDTENAGPNSPHVASPSSKDCQAIAAIAAIAGPEGSCARGSPVDEIEEEIMEEIDEIKEEIDEVDEVDEEIREELGAQDADELASFNLSEGVSPRSDAAAARLDAATAGGAAAGEAVAGEAVPGLEAELEEWRLAGGGEEEQPPPLEEGPALEAAAVAGAEAGAEAGKEVSPHTAAWQEYARLRKLSAGTPGWSTPGRTLAMEAVAGVSPSLSPAGAEVGAPYNPWLEYARLRKLSEDALCLTPPLPPARRRDCWWDRGVMVVEPLHEVRPRGSPRPPPLPPAARVRTPPRRRDGGWAWPAWAPAWAKRAAPPREDVVGVASLLTQLMLAGTLRACTPCAGCACVPCACPVCVHCPCTVLALCAHCPCPAHTPRVHCTYTNTLAHATHRARAAGALALEGFGAPPEPPPEPQTGGPLGRWASLLDKIIGA